MSTSPLQAAASAVSSRLAFERVIVALEFVCVVLPLSLMWPFAALGALGTVAKSGAWAGAGLFIWVVAGAGGLLSLWAMALRRKHYAIHGIPREVSVLAALGCLAMLPTLLLAGIGRAPYGVLLMLLALLIPIALVFQLRALIALERAKMSGLPAPDTRLVEPPRNSQPASQPSLLRVFAFAFCGLLAVAELLGLLPDLRALGRMLAPTFFAALGVVAIAAVRARRQAGIEPCSGTLARQLYQRLGKPEPMKFPVNEALERKKAERLKPETIEPSMGLVHEALTDETRALIASVVPGWNPQNPHADRKHWVANKDRSIFLVQTNHNNNRDEPTEYYALAFHGQVARFEVVWESKDDASGQRCTYLNILALVIPQPLEPQRDEIIRALKEALHLRHSQAGKHRVYMAVAPLWAHLPGYWKHDWA